jgi:DNA-binding Lrp family transcriptional regulator
MIELDPIDRKIINALQSDFPLVDQPYQAVALQFGLSEAELLSRLRWMLAHKVLTRFGPMFQIERMGGAFVLAALAVPESRYDEVTAIVNQLPAVAHNYRREHTLNMWFVLATETPAAIAAAIATIEHQTQLKVHAFPKEKEYFVEMKLTA